VRAYLDHASAAPLDARVQAAMHEFLGESFGAPSGLHGWAERPALAIEEARAHVAALVGADADEVIFTSAPPRRVTSRSRAWSGGTRRSARASSPRRGGTSGHPRRLPLGRTRGRAAHRGGGRRGGTHRRGRHRTRGGSRHGPRQRAPRQGEIGTVQDVGALVAAARRARPDVRVHIDAARRPACCPSTCTPSMSTLSPSAAGPAGRRPGSGPHRA